MWSQRAEPTSGQVCCTSLAEVAAPLVTSYRAVLKKIGWTFRHNLGPFQMKINVSVRRRACELLIVSQKW